MRIQFLLTLVLLPACTATSALPAHARWIDLTHDFAPDAVYWPTAPGFEITSDAKGPTPGGYWYESNTIRTSEHGGTHLDAPVHFAKDRWTTDQVPIDRLIGPACVIDATEACAKDRDHEVSLADLQAFEAAHGPIPEGAIVQIGRAHV